MTTSCGYLGAGVEKVKSVFSDDTVEMPEIRSRLKTTVLWSRSVTSDFSDTYLRLTPLLTPTYIYVCGSNGEVVSLQAKSGKQMWRQTLEQPITAGIGGGEAVIVGGLYGGVFAFSPKSGKQLWQQKLKDKITAVSYSHRDIVLVRTIQHIVAFDESSGQKLWQRKAEPPPLTITGSSIPILYKNLAFVGTDKGDLWVLALKSGKVLRSIKLGIDTGNTDLDRIVDIDGQMALNQGVLFAAAYQGRTIAVDLKQNQLMWTSDISSQSGLTANRKGVFIATTDDRIVAVDRITGEILWTNEFSWGARLSAPLHLGPFVLVSDERGNLFWLSQKSGKIFEHTQISNGAIAGMQARGKNVFVLDSQGDLTAIRLDGLRKKQ